ncbi:FHA domain-containing protein [Leptolyngbya sp. FACHB-36]|uniref:FHA domain-containing protein n=1 Tax=Leptolyngbya sp. FACHB-36 TaxID=2692808 RepID=UPI001681A72D|nr:FHA domain-containing protein [Leptolyngbya sp. FACHB-36]MBD2022583.1 FHA domain-containing protein [Leptolyngbya sp. FACHB-36]
MSLPHYKHVLVIEDDAGRREFTLSSPMYSVGRDPKCDIRLVSQLVSRHHATLVQMLNEDGTDYYQIVDGNLRGRTSANGVRINGRKLQAHDLENEDEIHFGLAVQAIYYCIHQDEPLNPMVAWDPTCPPDPDLPPGSYTFGPFDLISLGMEITPQDQ